MLAGAATVIPGGSPRSGVPTSESATEPEIEVPAAGMVREPTPALHIEAPGTTAYSRDARVPILMYHVIESPPADAGLPELHVRPADFANQMEWLDREGYTAVTLRAVWDHWHGRHELPPRPVVVTFDDGTRSVRLRAFPELSRHGWAGVLNLDLSNLAPAWGIRPAHVRELVDAGWELASHSATHPDLTALGRDDLKREVAGSRAEIRRLFGVIAEFFCYPSGRFDDRVVAAVRDAGYLGATTTLEGLARRDDPYRLARVRVNRSDGVDGFAAKLVELEKG